MVRRCAAIGLAFVLSACGGTDLPDQGQRTGRISSAISGSSANLHLQELTNSCGANQVQDFFAVTNDGATAVKLSDISVKLWVDDTSAASIVAQVYTGGCLNNASGCSHQVSGVTARAVRFSPACGPDANHQANWEITITNTDGTLLNPGESWSNLQTALHLSTYANFSPGTSHWYSSCLTGTSYTNTSNASLYVQGNLVTASTGVPPTCRAPHGSQLLHGEVPPGVSGASLVGPVPGTTPLTVAVGLPLTHQADAQTFLQQLYDPSSAQYRNYLSPDQFGAAYGPTQSDYNAVINFVQSKGLTVTTTYPSRALMLVSGTAAALESAFFVTLNLYKRADGSTYYAPANEPSLDLGVPILYVSGLNSFALTKHAIGGGGSSPVVCSADLNPTARSYVGQDFRNVYVPCTALDGSGQTVGLFELDDYYDQDVVQYETYPGFFPTAPSPAITRVAVPALPFPPMHTLGAPSSPCPISAGSPFINATSCATAGLFAVSPLTQQEADLPPEGEVALDIEMVVAMAPKAKVRVYEALSPISPTSTNNVSVNSLAILHAMANEPAATRPSTISSSWAWLNGSPDPNVPSVFLQFALQGQSFFQSSGDSGSYIPGGAMPVPWEPIIDSPLMTVVGGTQLTTNGSGAYSSETTWNHVAATASCSITNCNPNNGVCGCNAVGGGGICNGYTVCVNTSTFALSYQPVGTTSTSTLSCGTSYPALPLPSYQLGFPGYLAGAAASAGELSATTRMIPDVAMVADNLSIFAAEQLVGPIPALGIPSGAYAVLDPLGQCTGGTSAAAPLWAAVTALANQGSANGPVGFANPKLYALAAASAGSYSGNFNDVADNSTNTYPGNSLTPPNLFHAVAGYDMATGLGSPTCALVTQMAPPPPGTALANYPSTDGSVYAIAEANGTLYIGGAFSTVGGLPRSNVAAIDEFTGVVLPWNPGADNQVLALAPSGNTVYLGGTFLSVGGTARTELAAVDATTGAVLGWNPNPVGIVNALAVSGSTVFAGGTFFTISGVPRNLVAALSASTGTVLPTWDANVGGGGRVVALAVSGTSLYLGGDFQTVGGVTRNNLAAVNVTTGAVLPFNPNVIQTTNRSANHPPPVIGALAISGSRVYAGGVFQTVGGIPQNNVAAVDATSGALLSWNPNPDYAVGALAVSGNTVYLGGPGQVAAMVGTGFVSVGGITRNFLAAVDATTGAVLSWNPNLNGNVDALLVSAGHAYAGGSFFIVGGTPTIGFAAIQAVP